MDHRPSPIVDHRPSSTPIDTRRATIVIDRHSSVVDHRQLPIADDRSSTADRRSSSSFVDRRRYITTVDQPIFDHRSLVDDHQPSKIIDRISSIINIDRRLSMIDYQRSIDRSLVADQRSPIINRQSSYMIDHRSSSPAIDDRQHHRSNDHRSFVTASHRSSVTNIGHIHASVGVLCRRELCRPTRLVSGRSPLARPKTTIHSERCQFCSQHDSSSQSPYDRGRAARALGLLRTKRTRAMCSL